MTGLVAILTKQGASINFLCRLARKRRQRVRVIAGGGRVGRVVAKELSAVGVDRVVIEKLGDRVRNVDHALIGDAANFDVLVQESNAQDVRISALNGDLEKLGNVEQLFCSRDPRPANAVRDDLGNVVNAFPIPAIRFRVDGSLASVSEGVAICMALSDQANLIELTPSQLAGDGWRFKMMLEEGTTIRFGAIGPLFGGVWYLYERSSETG